jgi:ADP-ribose pyrophosphatase YjhB (NUDIX family)
VSDTREVVAAVCAVVETDGEVLAVYDRGWDAWVPPMGRVDPGESVPAATPREVREEAGIDVRVDRLVGVYSDPETQVVERPEGRTVQFVTTVLACTHESGVPEGDGEETTDARFFAPGALPEMSHVEEWIADAVDCEGPTLS